MLTAGRSEAYGVVHSLDVIRNFFADSLRCRESALFDFGVISSWPAEGGKPLRRGGYPVGGVTAHGARSPAQRRRGRFAELLVVAGEEAPGVRESPAGGDPADAGAGGVGCGQLGSDAVHPAWRQVAHRGGPQASPASLLLGAESGGFGDVFGGEGFVGVVLDQVGGSVGRLGAWAVVAVGAAPRGGCGAG